MPTISATLDAHPSVNGVTSAVTDQVGKLGAIASTVEGLIQHPPQGVGDLLGALKTLPLPDIQIGGDLPGLLGSLHSALPSDLSSVTGPLTNGLQSLQGSVGTDLAHALDTGLKPILDLAKFFGTDFTCKSGPTTHPGPGAAPAAAPAPAPPPAPPSSTSSPPGSPPPGTAQALDQFSTILGMLPSPLAVEALLGLFVALTTLPSRESFLPFSIPFLDDIHDSLETAIAWKAMQPAEIAASMTASVTVLDNLVKGTAGRALGTLQADLAAVAAKLQPVPLGTIADGMVARLGDLSTAVSARNLGGTDAAVAALNALADQLTAARTTLQADVLARTASLAQQLQGLPQALDDAESRLCAVVLDSGALPISLPADAVPAADDLAASVGNLLSPVTGWLQDLSGKLDLSVIQGPITTVANGALSAVDAFDSAMATVTTQVQQLFGQLTSLLDAVDLNAIVGQVSSAIDGFKTALINQLTQLFAPLRGVVEQAITTISQGVDAFNPQTLIDALNNVIKSVTDVLNAPEVAGAVNEIKSAVGAATDGLKSLSFSPVTGQVVADIGEVTTALKGLDPSTLSPALELALQGAVLVLPHDLSFATGPIEAEFDKIVDEGPGALVSAAKAPVGQLMNKVKSFEPASLIGDALSKPFNQLVVQMQAFTPSKLLEPVNAELATLKDRLKAEASPGRLLDPLTGPFNQLLGAFDQLKPDAIVKPLQDALSSVIDAVLKAIPVEDLLKPVGDVLAKIQEVATVMTKMADVVKKVHDQLTGLADGPAQLDAWIAAVVAKIGQIPDTGSLQAAIGQVATSVEATKAAPLSAGVDTALAPILAALGTPGPQAQLTAIVQAYRGLSVAAVASLPDPQKTAVTQVLSRINPLVPGNASPYDALGSLQASLASARSAVTTELAGWDAKYHGPDGALACLAGLQASTANLSTWLGGSLTEALRPVRILLAAIAPVAGLVAPLADELNALMTDVNAKVSAILTGPGSVGAIKGAIDTLIARLRGLNLNFLTQSLGDLFAHVRSKLMALDPAALKAVVDKAFADMLAALDLSLILPAADVAKLDADYTAVLTKLQALDPGKVVIAVVQPAFEQTVLPLIQAFDLSAALDTVAQTLVRMKGDLKVELGKVNAAYQEMLGAVPPFNPLSMAVSVSGVADAVGSLF